MTTEILRNSEESSGCRKVNYHPVLATYRLTDEPLERGPESPYLGAPARTGASSISMVA